ncbi:ATP-dependent acyl-CoA ligase [Mycolicibacterium agri]|uniref:ATP-dependent acyl-CoA ligase n=1 Tax=Mycolicibacterium agri TaxID=36811 RepID=A0A2A7N4B2_MYCAG|nr:AMP-binding protein [Mycolicibacterium agri]PEG38603.1 ATP-dependent acyl-CoA ligase [Mycolicibacterium agri]GFG53523.1 ATP-dependent acyl-CoA ligase [Mycolicibacterium agri]
MAAPSKSSIRFTPADRSGFTLPTFLRSAADKHPSKRGIRTLGGDSLTYAELLALSERRAAGLAALGVSKGDRVLLIMDNSIDMVVCWFAINLLGAVEVPVNTANRGPSLVHVANNSGATVAIIDARHAAALVDVAGELTALRTAVVRGGVPDLPWATIGLPDLDASPGAPPEVEVTYRDPASIIYTSGTTGPAKGVVVPHGHMHTFAAHVVEQLRIGEDDVYYICLPMFHANAQFMQVLPCLMTGAEVVLADAFSASRWLEDLRASGATVTSLLGVMAQYVFNQPATPHDADHHVRRMITIPLPTVVAEDFERRFDTTCVEAYGMTEICLPIYRPIDEPLRPGSCGKALDEWFEVAVVDPDTDEPVPDGAAGEIVVRPRYPFTTFLNYHAMPDRTVEAWRNLWFHTGDAARRDADGYYYFLDRLKDRIRRRGENITTYDVEVALTELPEIEEAAVIAKPAQEGEDDIKAYLVVAEDVSPPDPVAVLSHCVTRLPYFAVPRYLEFIGELPKTPTGKVLKRTLRAATAEPCAAEWDREQAGWTVRRGVNHLVRVDA